MTSETLLTHASTLGIPKFVHTRWFFSNFPLEWKPNLLSIQCLSIKLDILGHSSERHSLKKNIMLCSCVKKVYNMELLSRGNRLIMRSLIYLSHWASSWVWSSLASLPLNVLHYQKSICEIPLKWIWSNFKMTSCNKKYWSIIWKLYLEYYGKKNEH